MRRSTHLGSIDVGTTKICSMLANVTNGHAVEVLGMGVSTARGLHRGMIVNIDEAKEAIRSSVEQAEKTSGEKIRSACVSIRARHISSFIGRGVAGVGRSDRIVTPGDLERAFQAASSVTVPRGMKLLHVIPRGYAVDGQAGIKNPVGMHGFRVDVETHVITASVTSARNLVKCVRGIGVDIDDLVLEALASSEAVLTEDEKDMEIILIDIGGETTDLAIFRHGTLWHTSTLPVGGYDITRDIAIGLGLPFDLAEEIKKKHGKVAVASRISEEGNRSIEVGGNGDVIFLYDLYEIIYRRVEEILSLVLAELPVEYESTTSSSIVLIGGSSKLPGIKFLVKQKFDRPVRIGMPEVVCKMPGVSLGPEYATGIGLLLWQSSHLGEESGSFPKSWRKRTIKIKTSVVPEGDRLYEEKSDENIRDFEEAKSFFRRNKKKILSKYQDKYIAILKNRVIDSDEDFGRLAKRVYNKLGYRPIYMPKVVDEMPIIHVPSPRRTFPNR